MFKHKFLILFVALIATTALWAQNNVIIYTATEDLSNEYNLMVGQTTFGPAITSHTFSNGTGTITCEGEITMIGGFGKCALTSITIPNSVTTIGDWAFRDCLLTSIMIPPSVTTIGEEAFAYCCALTSVIIPNSVETIGGRAFYNVNNIVYSGTATGSPWGAKCVNGYIDGYLVYSDATKTKLCGCSFIATGEITIPYSVTTIGDDAFYGCSGLTSVTIPNSVTTIGSYAFFHCTGLATVTIPNSVTTIGNYAFNNCSGLTSVTIPNSVTTIGDAAFSGCSGLTSVTIPSSVTTIGNYAFYNVFNIVYSGTASGSPWEAKCVNGYVDGYLVYSDATKTTLCGCSIVATGDITIPNSVTTIEHNAFENCSGLTSITIPSSVTTIGSNAFYNVFNIVYSGTASGSPWGAKHFNGYVDGYLVYSDATKTTLCGCSSIATGEITLPFSVTTITKGTFNGCNRLNTISYFNYELKEQLINAVPSTTQIIYRGIYLETFETSPTVIIMRNTANTDKKVISSWGVKANGNIYPADNTGEILFTGLQPATTYEMVQCVQLTGETEWQEQPFNTITITTPALTLTTLNPKVVAEGKVVVAASTNISDLETNVGFEWRKYYAPPELPSTRAQAILYKGQMEGILHNLSLEYWKVRAYYEAADGTCYYGEWATFDPSQPAFFEPTVHTYALVTDPTANKVQMRGYVMTGTDDVTEQGFEYWFKGAKAPRRVVSATPDSVYRVQASGQVMTAVLENLAYSTTYTCRAYAIAGGETYYGEEVQFLTPEDPRPIYTLTVSADENGSVNETVAGQYREGEQVTLTATPDEGYAFKEWSDGSTDNPYTITIMSDTTLTATFEELPTALDEVTDSQKSQVESQKVIRDGILYIRRNGNTYNALGGEVR